MRCGRRSARQRRGRSVRWREAMGFGAAVVMATIAVAGCASPPSVLPTLGVVDSALAEEGRQLGLDGARQGQWYRQQREGLHAGFEADLEQRAALDAEWVRQATRVLTAALEVSLQREAEGQRQIEVRAENLRLAREALQRAIAVTQMQDRLFEGVPDVRRGWLDEWIGQTQEVQR